jgi:branched-chain amino acid transport system substrate-binding protein
MSWWHPAVRYKGETCSARPRRFNAAWAKKYAGEADYVEAGSAAAPSCKWRSRPPDDRSKVRDALSATDAETFYGHVKFGADARSTAQPPVFQLVGGSRSSSRPAAIKQGELRLMSR